MTEKLRHTSSSYWRMFVFIGVAALLGYSVGLSVTSPALSLKDSNSELVYGPWNSFPRAINAKYGGSEGVIAKSQNGKVVAGVFTHSGKYSYTFPFDEFAFVTSGDVTVRINGRSPFTLKQGDFVFFPKGTTAEFVAGENYANVAVFVGETEIEW